MNTEQSINPFLKITKVVFCATALWVIAISAHANSAGTKSQSNANPQDQFFLKIIGINQNITAKAEDFNSYWVGTDNGLWIINKHTARVNHLVEGSALPSNHITAICVTPDENVYVATDNGLFRYDQYSYLCLSTENSDLPTDNLTSLACDNNGTLWIGTKDKGVAMMKNARCKVFNTANSVLTDNAVKAFLKDKDGNLAAVLGNQSVVKIGREGIERSKCDLALRVK